MTGRAVEVDGKPALLTSHPVDSDDPQRTIDYWLGRHDEREYGSGAAYLRGWADADAHAEQLHRRAAEVTEMVARDLVSGRPVGREQRLGAMAAAGERLAAQLGRDRREAS